MFTPREVSVSMPLDSNRENRYEIPELGQINFYVQIFIKFFSQTMHTFVKCRKYVVNGLGMSILSIFFVDSIDYISFPALLAVFCALLYCRPDTDQVPTIDRVAHGCRTLAAPLFCTNRAIRRVARMESRRQCALPRFCSP